MNALAYALLEVDAEPTLPMGLAGWGILIFGLVVVVVWLTYLYR